MVSRTELPGWAGPVVFGRGHRSRLEQPAQRLYDAAMHDFETRYAAMLRRDPSLDGVIFVAVKTTGIYCRPVCRARIPLVKNVRFYPSAAAAEASGYRPCLRCRPETAPFCPAWKGTKTTVERALSMIEAGALDNGTVDALALRLGIGARHLSRVFAEHLGASPFLITPTGPWPLAGLRRLSCGVAAKSSPRRRRGARDFSEVRSGDYSAIRRRRDSAACDARRSSDRYR